MAREDCREATGGQTAPEQVRPLDGAADEHHAMARMQQHLVHGTVAQPAPGERQPAIRRRRHAGALLRESEHVVLRALAAAEIGRRQPPLRESAECTRVAPCRRQSFARNVP
jgi:hypothetical protein